MRSHSAFIFQSSDLSLHLSLVSSKSVRVSGEVGEAFVWVNEGILVMVTTWAYGMEWSSN